MHPVSEPRRVHHPADISTQIIGREAEIRTVSAAFGGLRRGVGGFLQVVGEPGIGKTCLLTAVRGMAVAGEADVLSGRAAEFEQLMPFQILLEALHEHLDGARLRQLVPSPVGEVLRSIIPSADPLVSAGGPGRDVDRFQLFQALRRLLAAIAAKPLVVLLDDVHWADPGSIDFIDFLSRRPMPGPLLVVVAHRDRQAPAQLRYALARNTDQGTVTRLELGPLSPAEAATLLGGRPGSRRVADLYHESQGNPLYLLTLDRTDGYPAHPGGPAWSGGDMSSRLESLLLGEIMTLSDDELTVASTASVVGDPFSVDLLTAVVADLDAHDVERALQGLIRRDLIRPGPHGPVLSFRHPLVRRAVYNRADPTWRIEAHRRALAVLTSLGASAAERGHHIEHCVSSWSPQHAAVLERAGHESMSTSPLTAAHWFRAALELLPEAAEFAPRRFGTSYLLARALGLGGRFTESRDLLHEILHAAPAVSAGSGPGLGGDAAVNRSAAVILCAHAEQRLGRYPEAIALLRKEIARLGAQTSPERIGLCLELGLTALLANDYPAARADISWARTAARDAGDLLGEATALAFSAFGEICVGHTAVAREAADAATRLVDGLPDSDLVDEREALSMLGWAEMLLERFADADRHLARSQAIIHRTGHSHGLPHVLLGQCLVSMFTGRMTEALERAEQAEDAAHLVGSEHLLGIVLAIKAPIQVWVSPLGQGGAALAAARRAAGLFTGSAVNSWWARNALMLRGHAELTNGDPEACVELAFQGGGPDLTLLGAPLVPEYAEILVAALIKLNRMDRAAEYADLAVAFAERLDLPGQRAHAARACGLLLALRGEQQAAHEQFTRADAWFAQAGRAVEQARTAVFAARTLAVLGRVEEAVAALTRSAAQAAAGGALWVRDELERVRDQLAEPPPAPTEHSRSSIPHGPVSAALALLTDREREVAGMVGSGRTNRQIATRLRLSERTVEAHLSNVYRKVGVASRTALASLLAREPGSSR